MINYHVYSELEREYLLSKEFFEGWPFPPSEETHQKILKNSYRSIVAIDQSSDEIIGFITIISDGILSAYIPLLEVVRSYRGRGIGKELVRLALNHLQDFYMVDLSCDEELMPFYESFGMTPARAMIRRHYDKSKGRADD